MTGPSVEDELIEQVFRLAREKAAALAEVDRLTTALAQAEAERDKWLAKWEGADDGWGAANERAEKAEADLRVLREGIEALATFYETSVRYEQTHPRHIIRRLRALLGEAS